MIPAWVLAALGLGAACAGWGALQVWLDALDPEPGPAEDPSCGACSLAETCANQGGPSGP